MNTKIFSENKYIAIQQPYFFPYIGYFHLLDASEIIIFYDDVNFIKKGWINRNRILNYDKPFLFSVPLKSKSQNKTICETFISIESTWKNKFYKQLKYFYKKSPYLKEVIDVVFSPFDKNLLCISDLAIESILAVYGYIGTSFSYKKSSVCYSESDCGNKSDRIIQITKDEGYNAYVNLSGGTSLYEKSYFMKNGIKVSFIKSNNIKYKQNTNTFCPNLSIIDIMMFNDKERIAELFLEYTIE